MAEEKKAPPKGGNPFGLMEPVDHANWPGTAPEISEADIAATYTADVVIAGGGHAGLGCALAAAEGGLSVIVAEKKKAEKYSWTGEQIGTYNSDFLTKKGFGNYDLDEVTEEYCKCYHYYCNPVLVERYVKKSGELLDHYISLQPKDSNILDDDQCNVHCHLPGTKYPYIRSGYKTWAATLQFRGTPVTTHGISYRMNAFSRLPEFLRPVMAESQRLGADWHFGVTAEKVIMENGRAVGLIVKNGDKYEKYLANKAVVLSMGSFTDRGHKLGAWAGGHMDNTPYEPMQLGMFHAPSRCFGDTSFLELNNNGKRFMNEALPYGNARSRQPDGLQSWVSDSKWLEQVKTIGLQHGNPDFGMPIYFEQAQEDMSHVVDAGAEGYLVRNLGLSERECGRVYGANTLEELAGFLGYTGEKAEAFVASVKRYNEMCYAGYDSDYHKDAECLIPIDQPPYYGGVNVIRHRKWVPVPRYAGEFNGLHTDDDLCVVDEDGNPIPGLYAAGETMGYARSVFYATPSGGNHIGMASTLGRELGKHLAGQEY